MSIAKVVEILSSSTVSFEDAIKKGIKRGTKTLRNVKGADVIGMNIKVDEGDIKEYRVHLKLSFSVEDTVG